MGAVPARWFPVAERLSRWARMSLLQLQLEKYRPSEIACLCGVSVQAVVNWIRSDLHTPGNAASVKLLEEAWRLDPRRVKRILRLEVRRHSSDLRKLGIQI